MSICNQRPGVTDRVGAAGQAAMPGAPGVGLAVPAYNGVGALAPWNLVPGSLEPNGIIFLSGGVDTIARTLAYYGISCRDYLAMSAQDRISTLSKLSVALGPKGTSPPTYDELHTGDNRVMAYCRNHVTNLPVQTKFSPGAFLGGYPNPGLYSTKSAGQALPYAGNGPALLGRLGTTCAEWAMLAPAERTRRLLVTFWPPVNGAYSVWTQNHQAEIQAMVNAIDACSANMLSPAGQVLVRSYPYSASYWFGQTRMPCDSWSRATPLEKLNAVSLAIAERGQPPLNAQAMQQLVLDIDSYCRGQVFSRSFLNPYTQYPYGYPYGYGYPIPFAFPFIIGSTFGGFGAFGGGHTGGDHHGK